LGNPGNKYEKTRHNVGFRFLDLLAQHEGLRFDAAPRFHAETATWNYNGDKVMLIKPQTFMNNSGESIGALARYYHVDEQDIIVIYDDLDLPTRKLRIKKGGGHGGHNGLRSLHAHLVSTDYVRIKIGINRPVHGDIAAWVLGKADEGDRADEACVLAALLSEINTVLDGDTDSAANRIHLALQ